MLWANLNFSLKNPHLQFVYNPHSSRCVLHVFVIQQKKGQPRLVITTALSNLRNLGSFLNNTLESWMNLPSLAYQFVEENPPRASLFQTPCLLFLSLYFDRVSSNVKNRAFHFVYSWDDLWDFPPTSFIPIPPFIEFLGNFQHPIYCIWDLRGSGSLLYTV